MSASDAAAKAIQALLPADAANAMNEVLDAIPFPAILPIEFEKAYIAFFSVCMACFIVLFALTLILVPKSWAMVEKLTVATSLVSGSFPGIFIPMVIWSSMKEAFEVGMKTPQDLPKWPSPPGIMVGCGMAIGYMTYDLIVMVLFYPVLIRPGDKAKRRKGQMNFALYMQMIMHHVLSIIFWPYAVVNSTMSWAVGYFMLTEMTNTGLNARGLLDAIGISVSNPIGALVSLTWVLQFTIVRIVPLPVLIYFLVLGEYSSLPLHDQIISCLYVPHLKACQH